MAERMEGIRRMIRHKLPMLIPTSQTPPWLKIESPELGRVIPTALSTWFPTFTQGSKGRKL
eukprot:CAMPEP_0203785886 /NCGR_PEP_ID=MMETSP0100_2-20121128/1286_1 /ASSEMBLY_ACC=CAM_ASM_000210 /TAXON_ID=96639 /ORGANISM=" , Strain NY0313808BC1" /LENGTH=60 /DNA_ID=CAMNT_0050688059 /DNA_START=1 /DNA_END=183 /DNA_ORIENTATION=+